MKTLTPRRLGMKRDIGHPTFMFRMVQSGREIKGVKFRKYKYLGG